MYSECVQLNQVTVWNPAEKTYFNRLNWSVLQGSRVLVMGNDGSGCKELFDIIAGYSFPQEGTVKVRGKLAVIREGFPLLEGLSVKDYLYLAMETAGKTWGKKDMASFLKEHELWEQREYKGEHLRTGEQCRLQLAMAEVQKPDIILMGACWKYMPDEEREQFWEYVRKRLDTRTVSFISFSDIRYMESEEMYFKRSDWLSQIYKLEHGVLTELKRGECFEKSNEMLV
ncbi:MAG: ATP-binding cassette domain-containing protein [Clostridium sp.]|nr:ATP-binding cassette domain-containing protein [Clostridium sp.]